MAAITDKDIYKGKQNPFQDVAKGGAELIKVMEQILSLGKDMSKATIADMNSNLKQSTSDLKKYTEDQTKLNQINKAASEIIKEKTRLSTTLTKIQSEEIKKNERLKVQIQEQRKANKQLAREQLGLIGSYEKLNKQLGIARKRAKDVAVQYGVTSKEFKKASKEVLVLDSRIKKIDRSLGLSQRQVGNYGLAFKGALRSMAGMAAGFIGIRQGFRVLRESVKTIADFEKAMDEVVAITGATNEEFERLEKNALKLGATTSKTAKEVAGLQKEFAKLGFTTDEILAATEATISLSIAAGSDLSESAIVAASTIRGFGLDAAETQRVVDVMAKSFTSSALDLEKFKTAMGTVAPVANSAGKSIEFTSARLSVLADAGIDASTAGTSLRNMFLELSKRGLTWEQGLAKINESTDKNVTALELFGKRGATAALVLAENTEKALKLEEAYGNATGAAKEMADIMEDNLIGDTKKLSSAWDGFILGLNDGEGTISRVFRGLTQWLTEVVTNLKLMNTTYEEIINNVKDDQLQELLKEDVKELNELAKAYEAFNDPVTARKRAIDALITSYSNLRPARQAELDDINKRLESLKELRKEENADVRLIDARIEKLEEEKLTTESGLYTLDKRIEAFVKMKTATEENNEAIEGTNESLKRVLDKFDQLKTLASEGITVKLGIEFPDLRSENEKFIDDLINENVKKSQIANDKLLDNTLERQAQIQELESQHYNSLLSIFYNYANRKAAQNKDLTNEELQVIIESNNQTEAAYQQLANSLISISNQILQTQINNLDQEIQAKNQQINELEQSINQELALLQQGAANEYQAEKQKLEKLQAERDKDIAERKKIQKQQETINTLTQISELATAVATIINSAVSELGWAGVVAGLAAAAAAIIGFSTYKSEAESVASAEEGGVFTKKGTHIEKGKRHSQGGNRYSAVEFERDEIHSVFTRDASKKHAPLIEDFTNAVNSGKLSKDEMEMYNYSLTQLNPNSVVINNNYSDLLNAVNRTNGLLSNQKIPFINKKGNFTLYDIHGKMKYVEQ